MTPKIAALDLDETLLHSDMTISEYSRNVIRQVQQKGIHVVIATGRMFSSACLKARELDIGDVPVICYTGAWIGLCESGTVLHKDSLPLSEARSVLALARRKGWMIQSYINDVLCLPEEGELEKKIQPVQKQASRLSWRSFLGTGRGSYTAYFNRGRSETQTAYP